MPPTVKSPGGPADTQAVEGRGRVRWPALTRLPAVATPRAVALATAAMFASGGGLALLSTFLPGGPVLGLQEIRVLAASALVIAAVLLWAGQRCPRWAFHVVLVCAWVMISRGVWVAGDELASTSYALLYVLVVINAFSSASWVAACAHLVLSLVGVTVTLSLAPGGRPAMVLMLAGVLVVMCLYTGRLVRAAASAEVDALTGLVNRRGLDRHLDDALSRADRTGAPVSAAVVDLDHFKRVNDAGGHAAGDALLQRVARTWSGQVPAGVLLARAGGDEFVLVAPRPAEDLHRVVERLRAALPAGASCSAGLAERTGAQSASELLARADAALYSVKRGTRGRTATAGPGVAGDDEESATAQLRAAEV